MDTSEKNFEATIVAALTFDGSAASPALTTARERVAVATGGYRKRSPQDYDRALCLDPGAVLDFIYATQPKEWARLQALYGDQAKERFLKRVAAEVGKRGTLTCFGKGSGTPAVSSNWPTFGRPAG